MQQHRDQSFGSLAGELISEVTTLLRQELHLAQAEAAEKAGQAQAGVMALLVGFLLAFCALLTLLQGLVIALSGVLPAWLASTLVGVAIAILAFAFIKYGQNNLRAKNLLPHRVMKSVREDRNMVMENVR